MEGVQKEIIFSRKHTCIHVRETPKTGCVLMLRGLQQDIIYLDHSINFQLDLSPKGKEVLKDHQEMSPDGRYGFITLLCKGGKSK